MNKNLLKAKIIEKGYNLGDFADAVRISRSSFSYKMNGIREFKYSEMLKIARALDLSSEEVMEIFFSAESIHSVHSS